MENPHGNYILCPYCMSVVHEDTVFCGVCGLDTTNDAKIEMTPDEYACVGKKNCPGCHLQIIKFATHCPHCLKKQA